MSISKLICLPLIAFTFYINVQAQSGKYPVLTNIIRDNTPFEYTFINLSATGETSEGTNMPLHWTWTPDGQGTRPYQDIEVHNVTNSNVSFVVTSSGEDSYDNNYLRDTRVYVGDYKWNQFYPLDDDHAAGADNRNFGAYITLLPNTSLVFRVFMYSSTSPYTYFNFAINPSSRTYLLEANYPTVTVSPNEPHSPIINGGN